MVGKVTTLDEFLKKDHNKRFEGKEDVLAWALCGYAKIVVSNSGEQSDDQVWNQYGRWLWEAPEGAHKPDADFHVFKISQEEFEQKIGIRPILDDLVKRGGEIDFRCLAADDAYLRKRIISEIAKMPEWHKVTMGKVWDFDEDAVRALAVNPPQGLTRICVHGWENEHSAGTSYEDQRIRQVMQNADPSVRIYNHGNPVRLNVRKEKTSMKDVFKDQANKLPLNRGNGGLSH